MSRVSSLASLRAPCGCSSSSVSFSAGAEEGHTGFGGSSIGGGLHLISFGGLGAFGAARTVPGGKPGKPNGFRDMGFCMPFGGPHRTAAVGIGGGAAVTIWALKQVPGVTPTGTTTWYLRPCSATMSASPGLVVVGHVTITVCVVAGGGNACCGAGRGCTRRCCCGGCGGICDVGGYTADCGCGGIWVGWLIVCGPGGTEQAI